ncbi:hypothetical protein VKT23_009703 [Stygiomarasmius scandens]|uniref:Uncharacterized protein n=1 Tax=Marasmiellus scandens TaxID=2682957 RepID=A0ABR1JFR3_9AGAR
MATPSLRTYSLLQHLTKSYKLQLDDSLNKASFCPWLLKLMVSLDPDLIKIGGVYAALQVHAEEFRKARVDEDIKAAFQALYRRLGCSFGLKPTISLQSIQSIADSFQGCRDIDSESLPFTILNVLSECKDVEYHSFDYVEICLKEIEDSFFLGADIVSAFKGTFLGLFQILGYDINDSYNETSQQREQSNESPKLWRKSMTIPFRGGSAAALLRYLTRCRREFSASGPEGFYAGFSCIRNSSGTGKTRTILELRKLNVPVLYINMRPTTDNKNYPPRDNDIASLFQGGSADYFYHTCLKILCDIRATRTRVSSKSDSK